MNKNNNQGNNNNNNAKNGNKFGGMPSYKSSRCLAYKARP